MITVKFSMKGQSADFRRFETMAEAQAFKKAMMLCDDCDGVWILR